MTDIACQTVAEDIQDALRINPFLAQREKKNEDRSNTKPKCVSRVSAIFLENYWGGLFFQIS